MASDRQLEHRRVLALAQPGQQDHLAARELERVMVFSRGCTILICRNRATRSRKLAGREEAQGMIACRHRGRKRIDDRARA